MSDFKRCRRYICGPANVFTSKADEWVHQEGCPLWAGVLPEPGERPVFGAHRLPGEEADTAPAWGGPDWVAQVYRAKKGSSDAEV